MKNNLSDKSNKSFQSDKELHLLFKKYGCNAKEWLRKCALLLPEIHSRQLWRKNGFGSIYEYAAKLAGMSRSSVDTALWVMRKIEDKPELQGVVEEKGVGRVRPVANIATKETEKFWAEKARDMSQNTLATFVRDLTRQNDLKVGDEQSFCFKAKMQPEKVEVSMSLKPEFAKKFEQLKKRGDFADLMEEFLGFVEAKVEEEKPEPVVTKSRHIPVKIKRFVRRATGGACAFPSCDRHGEVLHHTQRFALEKVHDPNRIVPLCKAHERLVHLGLIENEEKSPEKWLLRKEPNRTDHRWWVDQKVWLRR